LNHLPFYYHVHIFMPCNQSGISSGPARHPMGGRQQNRVAI
jgi:hypothetical protein